MSEPRAEHQQEAAISLRLQRQSGSESEVYESLGTAGAGSWELGGESVHWESKPQRRLINAREAAHSRERGKYSGFSLPPDL